MAEFKINPSELAGILNAYEVILSTFPLLDSPFPEIRVAAAEILDSRIMYFYQKVPEETRQDLSSGIERIKTRCLEVLSSD